MKLKDAVGLGAGDVLRAIRDGKGREKITLGREYLVVGGVVYRYDRTETTTPIPDRDLDEISFPIMNDKSKLMYISHTAFEVVGRSD